MAQKLITILPRENSVYTDAELYTNSVKRILANPSDRTLWIDGWPFGHAFISKNAAKEQPINAEVFNFYTRLYNGQILEGNAAYGNYSNAFGFNTVANNDYETAIGSLNYSIPKDYLEGKTSVFSIGIGNPENYATLLVDDNKGASVPKDNTAYRKNALLVTKDGSIYLKNTSEIINSKSVEYTPCEYTGGPLTGNEKSLQRLVSDTMKLKLVTYSELMSLRSLGQLVPGMKYRITDYRTTVTANDNGSSATHIMAAPNLLTYDVIVEAISETKLSKLARATYPTGYANDKITDSIHEWQLWYTLDNNKDIFPWADTRIELSYFTVQHSNNIPLFHSERYDDTHTVGDIIKSFGTTYINNVLDDSESQSIWFKPSKTLNKTRAEAIKTYRDFVYYDSYEYIHKYNDADNIPRSVTYTQRWLPCSNLQDVASDAGGDSYKANNNREASAADYYCALTEYLEPKNKAEGFANILICLNETTKEINENLSDGEYASEIVSFDEPDDSTVLGDYRDSDVELTSDKNKDADVIHTNYTFLAPDKLKVRLFIESPYESFEPTNPDAASYDNVEVEERYYLYDGPYYGSKFNQIGSDSLKSYYKWMRTNSSFEATAEYGLSVKTLEETPSTIYREPLYMPDGVEYQDLLLNRSREYLVTEGDKMDGSSTFDWVHEGGRTPYPGTRIHGTYLETDMAKRIKSSDILYVNGEDARPDDYLGAIAYTKYDEKNGREYYFSFSLSGTDSEIPYMLDTTNVFKYKDTTYMMWINTNSNDTTPIIITSPGTDEETLSELKYCTDDDIANALLKINFDDDGEYGSWLLYQDIKLREVTSTVYHCENSAYSVIRIDSDTVTSEFAKYIPATYFAGNHAAYNFVRLYDKYTYKQSEYYQWLLSYNDGQSFEGPAKDKQTSDIIGDVLTTHSSYVAKTLSKTGDTKQYFTCYYEPNDFSAYAHSYIIPLCKALPEGKFNEAIYHGKGIITRMIDEYGNDCPYDFKNILLKYNGSNYYTFSTQANYDGSIQDASLTGNCKNNVIKFESLTIFPKTIFNSTSFTNEITIETESEDGTETASDTTQTETVEISSTVMNNTIINCDNLIISNNCLNSTFSNVIDSKINREVYNSVFKNVTIDNSEDSSEELDMPYNCTYYNGPTSIINGIEKNLNTDRDDKVKSSVFSDDQVLFNGDNVVMFSKNTSINTIGEFKYYVGDNTVKTSYGKYIYVYKRHPSTGTNNTDSLTMPSFSLSNKELFDFTSLGTDFKLQSDGSTATSYTNQPFIGGIFTLDIGYRYENKWLCNHVAALGSLTLKLFTDEKTIYEKEASFSSNMPWDKSDHTTGVHLFWKVIDSVAAELSTAIKNGKKVYVTLSNGNFTMSTNSKSCYVITVDNFKFIPKTSTSTISNYSTDGDTGYKWGYASGTIDLSSIKVTSTTESGLAVIICANGIIVGTSNQAYKYTSEGASALIQQ